MQILEINGQQMQYVHAPLTASALDDSWGGRSNFLASNETEKRTPDLMDLDDCFRWMKEWSAYDDYKAGYVLDFSSKTVYYDTEEALTKVKNKQIPARKWENYFENFIQKDFSA